MFCSLAWDSAAVHRFCSHCKYSSNSGLCVFPGWRDVTSPCWKMLLTQLRLCVLNEQRPLGLQKALHFHVIRHPGNPFAFARLSFFLLHLVESWLLRSPCGDANIEPSRTPTKQRNPQFWLLFPYFRYANSTPNFSNLVVPELQEGWKPFILVITYKKATTKKLRGVKIF